MTNFQKVADMNVAFGNPKGDPKESDIIRLRKQCLNIVDELAELMIAMGADSQAMKSTAGQFKQLACQITRPVSINGIRDGLCDIHVFAYGAHHFMGIDADEDMGAVLNGVMTRFIKDAEDKQLTIDLHARKGVTDVYFEGEYPTMVMKSASDQPDAPKGKFLKSFSYSDTVFAPI